MTNPISVWTRADLEKLIADDVQESLTLDYKASPALSKQDKGRNEISKDVSAFANSAGGMIVYGITEKSQHPEAIDEGADDAVISREWLEQTINSTIQPRVQGIVIRQIALVEGRSAYVIEIPQATSLAPHQANDQKYYRRFNFQSVAMADYEIRDTLKRATTPDLFLTVRFDPVEPVVTGGLSTVMYVTVGNRSPEPAFYSTIKFFIDDDAQPSDRDGTFRRSEFTHSLNIQQADRFVQFHRNLSPTAHQPIFKEETFRIGEFPMPIRSGLQYPIGFNLACPGFKDQRWFVITARNGQVELEWISGPDAPEA
jgi:hypothetical protein